MSPLCSALVELELQRWNVPAPHTAPRSLPDQSVSVDQLDESASDQPQLGVVQHPIGSFGSTVSIADAPSPATLGYASTGTSVQPGPANTPPRSLAARGDDPIGIRNNRDGFCSTPVMAGEQLSMSSISAAAPFSADASCSVSHYTSVSDVSGVEWSPIHQPRQTDWDETDELVSEEETDELASTLAESSGANPLKGSPSSVLRLEGCEHAGDLSILSSPGRGRNPVHTRDASIESLWGLGVPASPSTTSYKASLTPIRVLPQPASRANANSDRSILHDWSTALLRTMSPTKQPAPASKRKRYQSTSPLLGRDRREVAYPRPLGPLLSIQPRIEEPEATYPCQAEFHKGILKPVEALPEISPQKERYIPSTPTKSVADDGLGTPGGAKRIRIAPSPSRRKDRESPHMVLGFRTSPSKGHQPMVPSARAAVARATAGLANTPLSPSAGPARPAVQSNVPDSPMLHAQRVAARPPPAAEPLRPAPQTGRSAASRSRGPGPAVTRQTRPISSTAARVPVRRPLAAPAAQATTNPARRRALAAHDAAHSALAAPAAESTAACRRAPGAVARVPPRPLATRVVPRHPPGPAPSATQGPVRVSSLASRVRSAPAVPRPVRPAIKSSVPRAPAAARVLPAPRPLPTVTRGVPALSRPERGPCRPTRATASQSSLPMARLAVNKPNKDPSPSLRPAQSPSLDLGFVTRRRRRDRAPVDGPAEGKPDLGPSKAPASADEYSQTPGRTARSEGSATPTEATLAPAPTTSRPRLASSPVWTETMPVPVGADDTSTSTLGQPRTPDSPTSEIPVESAPAAAPAEPRADVPLESLAQARSITSVPAADAMDTGVKEMSAAPSKPKLRADTREADSALLQEQLQNAGLPVTASPSEALPGVEHGGGAQNNITIGAQSHDAADKPSQAFYEGQGVEAPISGHVSTAAATSLASVPQQPTHARPSTSGSASEAFPSTRDEAHIVDLHLDELRDGEAVAPPPESATAPAMETEPRAVQPPQILEKSFRVNENEAPEPDLPAAVSPKYVRAQSDHWVAPGVSSAPPSVPAHGSIAEPDGESAGRIDPKLPLCGPRLREPMHPAPTEGGSAKTASMEVLSEDESSGIALIEEGDEEFKPQVPGGTDVQPVPAESRSAERPLEPALIADAAEVPTREMLAPVAATSHQVVSTTYLRTT